jgi:predicted MPP superfamily phosphohydrolase
MVSPGEVEKFAAGVVARQPDVVLIGGDTSESKDLVEQLSRLARLLRVPIYFVLGNHDYYYGSIEAVRTRVADLCRREPSLHYLSLVENVTELSPHVGLVGHDGWADGRLADYFASSVMMNDDWLIAELIGLTRAARWERLKGLADEAAAHIRRILPLALERYPNALLLTHVPPFRDACWYAGEISNDDWLPHFTCHAMGESIRKVMADHPDRALTVLCGHTHGRGEARPLPNVLVLTGGAQYGCPEVQRLFEFE